jgi:MFS family permease
VLGTLVVAALCFSLAQTTVVAALPAISREYGVSATTASWAVTVYMLSASVCTPLVGKLGDVHGRGRVLGWVMAVFALGSLLCALSSSIGVLLAGRALQGAAGGVFPLAFGIINDELPPDRRALGVGLVSGMFGGGAAIGLPLAGVIVDHGELAWIFWALLIAVPGAVLAWTVVPPSPVHVRRRMDWRGAGVLSAGLAGVLLAISEGNGWGWTAPATVGCFAGGLALLVAFLALQARTPEPLVDVRVLRRRSVLATNIAGLCCGTAMFSAFVLVPQLAQADPSRVGFGLGLSLTQAGLVTVPMVGMMLVAAPLAGLVGGRLGFRVVLAGGAAIGATAFALLAVAHGSTAVVFGGVFLLGVGIALAFAGMSILTMVAVPAHDVGIATAINTIMRTIGAALGTALVTAILAAHPIAGTAQPTEGAFVGAFVLCAVIALAGAGAALWIPPDRPARHGRARERADMSQRARGWAGAGTRGKTVSRAGRIVDSSNATSGRNMAHKRW